MAVGEKIVGGHKAAVADAMQQVLQTSPNEETAAKAKAVLKRAGK